MDSEHWDRVEALFDRAVALPPEALPRFIEQETAGDEVLGRHLRALIAAHGDSHPLLDAWSPGEMRPGLRIGPWALDGMIGAGGMGCVYLAHRADEQFEKKVAIKLLNKGLAAALHEQRFRRERQILAKLEHPGIARLLDSGINEFGQPYAVMEYVEGLSLSDWLHTAHPVFEERIEVWLKIADAVSYAHRNLIVHRDLKPSNVLVASDGNPKLLDFGIAKLLAEEAPAEATGTGYMTLRYASPEQIGGKPVSTASDVFSLGVLLLELLTGDDQDSSALPASVDEALRQERRVPASLPKDLGAVLRMALRAEPERRYISVDQFADDVRRFRKRLPVLAQPESRRYHSVKFLERHRAGATVALAAILALLSATSAAIYQARKADRQRLRAEKISDFLAGIMGVVPGAAPDSLRNRGVGLRVVDLVNAVAARTDSELANDPEAESTLRYVIASSYAQMGLLDQAERHSARGLELARRVYAPSDQRLLNAHLLDTHIQLQLGRFAHVESELLDVSRIWPSPPPMSAAALLSILGIAQLRQGKLDAAESSFKRCLAVMERTSGTSPWLGTLLSNLSLIHQERGQYELALPLLERAVSTARGHGAEHSESLAWSLTNLAAVERILDRPESCRKHAYEALEQFESTLGASNHHIVNAAAFVAWAETILGDAGSGEAHLRKAMESQRDLPRDHFERALSLSFLGFVQMRSGRTAEAVKSLSEALEIRRKAFRSPNWRIAETAGYLGEALARNGEHLRAQPLLEESLETMSRLFGEQNVRTADARRRLALWGGVKTTAGPV